MKKIHIAVLASAITVGAALLYAQETPPPDQWSPRHPRDHHHPPPPPPPPLLLALDANHDGIIDAQEIANASNALLKLDKNHDGQLTRDELRPPCPFPDGPPPEFDGDDDAPDGNEPSPWNQ